MASIQLTTAQALVRYLIAQRIEIDGESVSLFAGVFAIFGHGNVAGLGEALYAVRDELPTYRAHNEQAMGHTAAAFAKAVNGSYTNVVGLPIALVDRLLREIAGSPW